MQDLSHKPVSSEEMDLIKVVRLNRASPRTEIRKNWRLGRLAVQYHWRSKKNLWGRFGGGWNWKLGFQVGGSTVIVDLLVFSLRFSKAEGK